MDQSKPSWIDYVNLVLTVFIGAIGIYVAVIVSKSSDRLNGNSLMLATATFILDDKPKLQSAGIEIYTNLKNTNVPLPPWSDVFISHVLAQGNTAPPSEPTAPAEASPSPEPSQTVANQLFVALAETAPRLFIEIADEDQRTGANALRRAVAQVQLSGQTVIAPGVERVNNPPSRVELRVLKAADRGEAGELADALGRILGLTVAISDLSRTFDSHADVKRRTYELWFPHGRPIAPAAAKS